MSMDFNKFVESLEKKAGGSLFEQGPGAGAGRIVPADQVISDGAGGWFYVPKQTFLSKSMKVAVHEIDKDKWQIFYMAPLSGASEKARTGAAKLAARGAAREEPETAVEEIQKYTRMLNENIEGDAKALPNWFVKVKSPEMSFEDCIKTCVDLVKGKADAIPTAFKRA
jgi:hypothetical protein